MARQERCKATTQAGDPCRSFAISADGYCVSHDPSYRSRKHEGSRRGGEAKANARRAAKLWASIGNAVNQDDLPAMLRACLISVRDGTMEPAQASAIAGLAKASVSITNEIELEARLTALEALIDPTRDPKIRRIG
jgi:hypothetical protein